jgi:hypothetical protein
MSCAQSAAQVLNRVRESHRPLVKALHDLFFPFEISPVDTYCYTRDKVTPQEMLSVLDARRTMCCPVVLRMCMSTMSLVHVDSQHHLLQDCRVADAS